MLNRLKELIQMDRLAALVTWAFVTGSSVYLLASKDQVSMVYLASVSILYLCFIVMWLMSTDDKITYPHDRTFRLVLVALQYVLIVVLMFLVPFNFSAILIAPWVCQLPYYCSYRWAMVSSPIWSSAVFWVQVFYWQHSFKDSLISACLYWTLNIFALVMMESLRKETLAREKADQLNRELLSTQALLSQATKQAERVRIARNIHDLLGHHLTALTINLQVAARITSGDAKEKVDECHGLAKLLLSDVREAVSEIREKSNLELKSALLALIEGVPKVKVSLDYDQQICLTDVTIAEAILRCVQESLTNSLKHSHATEFNISIQQRDKLQITMHDNGGMTDNMTLGNGLTGIRERIQALGGEVRFDASETGFFTEVVLP